MSEDLGANVNDLLDDIDFAPIEKVVSEFDSQQVKMFSLGNVKDKIQSIINGEQAVDYNTIIEVVLQVLAQIIIQYVPMFALIVGIGIIASLLGQIKSKFNEKSTSDIVHFVCFCLIVIIMATSIKRLITSTTSTIGSMENIINIVFPIILTLMTGIGAVSSVGVFRPVLALMSNLISTVIFKAVVPIFVFSFVLNIIGHLSNNIKLDKFNSFLSSLFKWSVGIVFTLFTGFLSLQGITAGRYDSVSIKATKFAVKSYIPIIGSYISEGMDFLVLGSVLVKNTVGLVGVFILFLTVLSPIISILIIKLGLQLSGAILEMCGSKKLSEFTTSCSKLLIMPIVIILGVAFMYLITIALIMCTANIF
jgi:stage III sporulation protein AE